jgi:hypothetical protein
MRGAVDCCGGRLLLGGGAGDCVTVACTGEG